MSQDPKYGAIPRVRSHHRRLLIVSFDVARERDPIPSLAVGSLLAYARSQSGHGRDFELLHHSIRLDGIRRPEVGEVARGVAAAFNLRRVDVIALAAYAWSESLIDPLMRHLRDRGFSGDFVVGGYQVTTAVDMSPLYAGARYLVEGPAERELLRVLLDRPHVRVLNGQVEVQDLVSPYLAGVIDVPFGAQMVRMETQRGCRWRCSFCSYRGRGEGPVVPLPLDRVTGELRLFAAQHVAKVNVLDPEFNGRRGCLDVLRAMIEVGLRSRVTVQARPEVLVKAPWGREFLDLCGHLDVHLEFGLQTAIHGESAAVNRENDLEAVSRALHEVSARRISHEVSLMYGLPHQTVESFAASLEFARRHDVPTIRCFPLMLHRGTALSRDRERFHLSEEVLDAFDIPFVTSSSTFTREEWSAMREMADEASGPLDADARVSPAVGCGSGRADAASTGSRGEFGEGRTR